MNVRGIVSYRNLSLYLGSSESSADRINYSPNNRGFIGVGAFVFDLGFEVSVRTPQRFERDIDDYGETDYIDIQTHIYGKKWNFDLALQRYQGFFISNPGQVDPYWQNQDAFPTRRDLRANHFLANVIYLFNSDDFSFRAAFNQTEKQIRSAGSTLILTSFTSFRLFGDSVLVHPEAIDPFGPNTSLVDGRFNTLSLMPGYSYNFTYKNILINATVSGGLGLQYQNYEMEAVQRRAMQVEPKVNFRAALIYDTENFFVGTTYVNHQSKIYVENLRINNSISNLRLFAGYRFKKFGIFKRFSINDILKPLERKLFGEIIKGKSFKISINNLK
ncbi:hypothetical protein BH23BAC1_BH23BAC1_14260 [soil metagenome]